MKNMLSPTMPPSCKRKHMEENKPPPENRSETDATPLEKVILKKEKVGKECHNQNEVSSELERDQRDPETEVRRNRNRLMTSISAESRTKSSWNSLMRWTLVAAILFLHSFVSRFLFHCKIWTLQRFAILKYDLILENTHNKRRMNVWMAGW